MKNRFRHARGLHLLELLAVVTIIGIMTAASMPVYTHYVVKARRLEAAGALSKLALAMEQYHIENATYRDATLKALHLSESIANGQYQLVIQTETDSDYLIAAEPVANQAKYDVSCAALALSANGEKTITGSGKVDECW